MVNTILFKYIFNIFIFMSVLLIFYFTFIFTDHVKENYGYRNNSISTKVSNKDNNTYNVWLIFTKVVDRSPLTVKFKKLLNNLLIVSSVPLQFHIFVDKHSKIVVQDYMQMTGQLLNKTINYRCYEINKAAILIQDIVSIMTPHFSSKPGTYYSDALFYLSLGLHRIAPKDQEKAIMLDCDLYFKDDIALLFEEFDRFLPQNLFGLAPELTPVYRHVLHSYKMKHNSSFGEYLRKSYTFNDTHSKGYQGYNSGVLLLNLSAIRNSNIYEKLLKSTYVNNLVKKYYFKGHLGDQDFYTLLGYEKPELVHTLSCGFNRQLCVWWRDHGYKDVFDRYFKCEDKIIVIHGNCNTKIPQQ